MSEVLKKLREEGIAPKAWHKRYEPLSGMSNIERQVEDARRKEHEIKAELKETEKKVKDEQERIVRELINVLDARRGDEARDASNYFNLAKKYSNIPSAAKVFQQLSTAESEHESKLRLIAGELERRLKQRS